MDPALIKSIAQKLQPLFKPALWSKGVQLSRQIQPILLKAIPGEILFRIPVKDRIQTPTVTIWPPETPLNGEEEADDLIYCDCDEHDGLCHHSACLLSSALTGQLQTTAAPKETSAPPRSQGLITYHFSKHPQGTLEFQRLLDGKPLTESLIALAGGRQSGRLSSIALAPAPEDFAVELLLKDYPDRKGPFFEKLMGILAKLPCVYLDGEPLSVSAVPLTGSFHLESDFTKNKQGQLILKWIPDPGVTASFKNGLCLWQGRLRPERAPLEFQQHCRTWLIAEWPRLLEEVLPRLEQTAPVHRSPGVPTLSEESPILDVQVQDLGHHLFAFARIVYGSPPSATFDGHQFQLLNSKQVPKRKVQEERALMVRLRDQLGLSLGQSSKFQGADAVLFQQKLKTNGFGTASQRFEARKDLTWALHYDPDHGFSSGFSLPTSNGDIASISTFSILESFRQKESLVRLGSEPHTIWAELPLTWIERNRTRLERIAALFQKSEKTPLPPSVLWSQLRGELTEEERGNFLEHAHSDLVRQSENISQFLETQDPNHLLPLPVLPSIYVQTLRSYQEVGARFLYTLHENQMGALLADDMGLGKTLQSLVTLGRRNLIVCPASVVNHWVQTLEKFRPDHHVVRYWGSQRSLPDATSENSHPFTVITTYATLRQSLEVLTSFIWDGLILDEAHYIKNHQSQSAQAVFQLRAKRRTALTGTPVENRLSDLWSLFQAIQPGYLGTLSDFMAQAQKDPPSIKRSVKPFVLRRLKQQVALDLPSRTEIIVECDLEGEQKSRYDQMYSLCRREVRKALEESGGKPLVFSALEMLLKLRQAATDPRLHDPQWNLDTFGIPAKLEVLTEMLETCIAEGHRALVFSQWTSYLDLIEAALRQRSWDWLRLDGSVPLPQRASLVERFQDPAGPSVMLLSLKAAGVGLTLTAADHVFIMDPWWNPTAEDQAADRAHRIGQSKPVFIHKLVAKDTIEERILDLQRSKRALAEGLLSDSGENAETFALTEQDVIKLFEL